ncbi:MAG: uroporphyrinogen-III C-methyltransferase [Prochlorotrichaceae cyanobacterium]
MGKVYLVGAGSGDPELLTLKAKAILERADVVFYDALISPEILALMPKTALRIHAGKRRGRHSLSQPEITAQLLEKAQHFDTVVRLKGGDPFIFGRGAEEAEALLAAGIAVEVIPGVTAGVAVPAYAGIPLTHRLFSSSVAFVTGHESAGKYAPQVQWRSFAQGAETIVIYMGLHNLAFIVTELMAGGKAAETPIALISEGTCPTQQVLVGNLSTIVEQAAAVELPSPTLAIVGTVVTLHPALWPVSPLALEKQSP